MRSSACEPINTENPKTRIGTKIRIKHIEKYFRIAQMVPEEVKRELTVWWYGS